MPAGPTYEIIESKIFSSAAIGYTFTSIPQTYTDLQIVWSAKETQTAGDARMQFNGDTTSGNYIWSRFLMADGVPETYNYTVGNSTDATWISQNSLNVNYYQAGVIDIFNYTNTNMFKNVFAKIGSGYANQTVQCFMNCWKSTAAITSLNIFDTNYNFDIGTTITLYGIKAA
jgi:hypothetical protein